MSMLLIGLTGPAHSGKTTAARDLIAHYNLLHYAFAQPLKAMLAQGLNLILLNDSDLDRLRQRVREAMQLMAAHAARYAA